MCLRDDRLYADYVGDLIFSLFGYRPSIIEYPKYSVIRIIVTGVLFVKMMEDLGLKVGDKVRHQVGIPEWIKFKENYFRACIRGLFDTDGGTFFHKHCTRGYHYRHFRLTFTSASRCLLDDFRNCLGVDEILIHGKKDCLFLYKGDDIGKFFEIYGPRNLKHKDRYEEYLSKPSRLS